MKYLMLHMPTTMMLIILKMMIAMPLPIRKSLFNFIMRQLFSTTNDELQEIMEKMVDCAFLLSNTQSRKYADTRVAVYQTLPKNEAIRIVHSMTGFCRSGSIKDYAREQGSMQRAILNLTKEKQFEIAEIFEPAGASGLLPINIAIESIKKTVTSTVAQINATNPAVNATQSIRRIYFEELRDWLKSKKQFILIETLPSESYDAGHIPMAVNVPAEGIEIVNNMFMKNDIIVLYCRSNDCLLSGRCAQYMIKQGFTNIYDYKGGKLEWMTKGEPLESKDGRPGTCKENTCIVV